MTSGELPDPRAAAAVAALGGRGWTLATAESLTAGLLAATVAGVPGASAVLRGGLVVYATDLKHELAGVPEEVLQRHG
ncbi:MAG: CinA family protein, partial [Dietzia sp.]